MQDGSFLPKDRLHKTSYTPQNESAVNDSGFEVDFLRREIEQGVLFVHPVISATGKMATMRTVAPQTFVEFKSWMATHAQNREASKRRRDQYQSTIVQALIADGLLHTP